MIIGSDVLHFGIDRKSQPALWVQIRGMCLELEMDMLIQRPIRMRPRGFIDPMHWNWGIIIRIQGFTKPNGKFL